jgi:hypothetical protein
MKHPSMREIRQALDANGWHAGRACRALGIGRATLWRRLTARGISLRTRKKKVWHDFWLWEEIDEAVRAGRLPANVWSADFTYLKQSVDFRRSSS